jgi:uncharacterized protein YycO
MKTNLLIITAILIVTGSFFVNLSAQEALKAVAKKCENTDGVKTSIVKSRQQSMTSIRFANNEELKKEILAAFEKDRDQADRSIEDKESGKIVSLRYSFGKTSYSYSEDEEKTFYSYSKDEKNGGISFSIIERYE